MLRVNGRKIATGNKWLSDADATVALAAVGIDIDAEGVTLDAWCAAYSEILAKAGCPASKIRPNCNAAVWRAIDRPRK